MPAAAKPVPVWLVKEVAAANQIDWRTVLKALDGEKVRGAVASEKATKAAAEVRRRHEKPEKGSLI